MNPFIYKNIKEVIFAGMDRRIGDFYPAPKRINLKDKPDYLSGRPV